VFEKCICNELKSKARVLVTNQVQYLPSVDKIVLLEKGRIIACDNYPSLLNTCEVFQRFVEQQTSQEEEQEVLSDEYIEITDEKVGLGEAKPESDSQLVSTQPAAKLIQEEVF
jgi:ABC-type multidrug transport system ATPase subunit